MNWYYGPTAWDDEPARMWHADCPAERGEVFYDKEGYAYCLGCDAVQDPDPRMHIDYDARTDSLHGQCCECDRRLIWGGMSWWPHSEEYHAGIRRRLLRAFALAATGKVQAARVTVHTTGVDPDEIARRVHSILRENAIRRRAR